MIWSIKYKRTISGKVYDKVSTFITKETNACRAYHKWLKQRNGLNSIELVSISEKYRRLRL